MFRGVPNDPNEKTMSCPQIQRSGILWKKRRISFLWDGGMCSIRTYALPPHTDPFRRKIYSREISLEQHPVARQEIELFYIGGDFIP